MNGFLSSLRKHTYTLAALSAMLGGTLGMVPARAEAVATIQADIQADARLVGLVIEQVGSDAKGDLAALGNAFFSVVDYAVDGGKLVATNAGSDAALLADAFFETFEGVGSATARGGKMMAHDFARVGSHAFDGVGAIGETLAVASDAFFDGIQSMGSGLAMAGDLFFNGAEHVGSGLAFVGERVDGALFANTHFSPGAQIATRNTFPRSQVRESTEVVATPTPLMPLVPNEPAALAPEEEPVSAVAGLKVVSNNLVLNTPLSSNAVEADDANYYLGSASVHMANNNYAAAQTDLEKALALGADAASTYEQLADAHELSGSLDGAIAAIERGLSKNGRANEAYLQHVGRLYFKRHSLDDLIVAERAFQEALAINPNSREAIFALGAIAEAKDNATTN